MLGHIPAHCRDLQSCGQDIDDAVGRDRYCKIIGAWLGDERSCDAVGTGAVGCGCKNGASDIYFNGGTIDRLVVPKRIEKDRELVSASDNDDLKIRR